MKRIKAMNGYTIYEVTERDERQGNGTAGEYAIYFSSDVREYGREYSYPEFDGVETLAQAIELIEGEGNYAKARELCEKESTAVTFEDIEEMQERLNRLDADRAQEVLEGDKDIEEAEEEQEEEQEQGYTWSSEWFYGHKVSDYGLEHGYVDYKTLASAFDAVLNNEIFGKAWEIGYGWEQESGFDEDEENPEEVFQWYIVSDAGAEI